MPKWNVLKKYISDSAKQYRLTDPSRTLLYKVLNLMVRLELQEAAIRKPPKLVRKKHWRYYKAGKSCSENKNTIGY